MAQIVDLSGRASFKGLHPLQPVQGLIMHHTAGGRNVDDIIHTFQQRNFPAQFVIDRTGIIYQVLPTGYTGRQIVHNDKLGLSNANTIGVEIIGANDKDIQPIQVQAAQQLYQYLAEDPAASPWRASGLSSDKVYGHGVVNPGDREPTEGLTAANAIKAAFPAGPAVAAGQAAPAMRDGVTPEARSTYSLLTTGDPRLGVAPLPAQVAAGAVGNMMQESYANLRPDAKGAAGEIGIGQWMPDRYASMVAWTTANGLDPSSREGQALFYSHELQASPAMADLANAQTPADAAQIIASKFERAGSPMMDRRVGYANAVAGSGSALPQGSPVDETTLASLDMGGIPGKFVTDTQAAQPVTAATPAARIPDDAQVPGGMAPVINAIAAGDAAATKAAWQQNTEFTKDPNGTLNWLKTEFPKQFPAVERAAAEKWHVVKAAFSPMAQGAVQDAFKSAPPITAAPISFSPSLTNGAWGIKSSPTLISDTLTRDVPGSTIPEAQSEISQSPKIYTGFDAKSGAGSLFGDSSHANMRTPTSAMGQPSGPALAFGQPALAQSASRSEPPSPRQFDVPSWADPSGVTGRELPTQPTSPYGRRDQGEINSLYPAATSTLGALGSSLAKMSPAAGAMAASGYASPPAALPLTADADPVAKSLAGVAYMSPEADPKPAYTMAPKPQAPVRQITYRGGGPIAGATIPVSGRGSMGGVGLGAFAPTIANVISASRNAGYTTGVASPGYTSSPAYQAAMSHGYSAPNFSKGSGGSTYAYKSNGQGGGTFVTTDGRTLSY